MVDIFPLDFTYNFGTNPYLLRQNLSCDDAQRQYPQSYKSNGDNMQTYNFFGTELLNKVFFDLIS